MTQGRQAVDIGTGPRSQGRRSRVRGGLAAFGLAAMLAGCGGGGDADSSPRSNDMNDDSPSTGARVPSTGQGTDGTTGGGTGQGGTGTGSGDGGNSTGGGG